MLSRLVMSDSVRPHGHSPPGSSAHGPFQARIREGLPFPTPGDRPSPRIEPRSPALTGRFFLTEPPRKPRRECDSAMKTKGTMSSAGTGMDLEVIILGEVSHRKTSVWYGLYVDFKIWYKLIYLQNRDSPTQKTNVCLPNGKGDRRDKLGVWDEQI